MPVRPDAEAFAAKWTAAWNAHDLERILSHWSDVCVFSSPLISRLTGDDSATVHGKDALGEYWRKALAASPSLHFVFDEVLVGHDSLVVRYHNHRGERCAEWLRFGKENLVIEGAAHRGLGH